IPGLAFAKIAKTAKTAGALTKATKWARESRTFSRISKKFRASADVAAQRVSLRVGTKEQIRKMTPKNKDGNYIDPNTQQVIQPGRADIGHKPGYEWRCMQAMARHQNWTRAQLIEYANDLSHYQIEDRSSNRSHQHEAKVCKI
ncbi:MAG: HNH/ENDO VII family nuclease, partial [Kineosporiaceae bacterium]|nr:HNH/ENDO VII family nuclease [Aeromicrobium sp.]